jgi:hypothetical protein
LYLVLLSGIQFAIYIVNIITIKIEHKKEETKMNVARKIEMNDTAYKNRYSKKSTGTKSAEIITLISKNGVEEKEVTLDYLNEKLAYFYNNGGPIMDI